MLHESSGNPWAYRSLAGYGKDWSIVALEAPDRQWVQDSLDIPELVLAHVNEIRRIQPRGPYFLGGWSSGALLAFETARRLARDGQETRRIIFLDPVPAPNAIARLRARIESALPRVLAALPFGRPLLERTNARSSLGRLGMLFAPIAGELSFTSDQILRGLRLAWPDRYWDARYDTMTLDELLLDLTRFWQGALPQNQWEALLANWSPKFGPEGVFKAYQVWMKNMSISRLYTPTGALDVQVDAFFVEGRNKHALTWQRYLKKPIQFYPVAAKNLGLAGVHNHFLQPTNLDLYAQSLFDSLDKASQERTVQAVVRGHAA